MELDTSMLRSEVLCDCEWFYILILHKNLCCGDSSEVLQWSTSKEYPQHMFLWRIKKIIYLAVHNLELCFSSKYLIQILVNSADNKSMIFSYFSKKIDFDISCKLSPSEMLCMKCKSLFFWEKEKNIFQTVVCWNFYPGLIHHLLSSILGRVHLVSVAIWPLSQGWPAIMYIYHNNTAWTWIYLTLSMLGKNSADDILKFFFFFSNFSQKTDFDISCKLSPEETICMKCQNLFSGKNKTNTIALSSAE